MMRTTINLPDDVYQIAKSVARLKDISIGDAIAELVRDAVRPPLRIDTSGVFPHFVLPPGAGPILTTEKVKQLLEEDMDEEDRRKAMMDVSDLSS
jgi:hypothetical protein